MTIVLQMSQLKAVITKILPIATGLFSFFGLLGCNNIKSEIQTGANHAKKEYGTLCGTSRWNEDKRGPETTVYSYPCNVVVGDKGEIIVTWDDENSETYYIGTSWMADDSDYFDRKKGYVSFAESKNKAIDGEWWFWEKEETGKQYWSFYSYDREFTTWIPRDVLLTLSGSIASASEDRIVTKPNPLTPLGRGAVETVNCTQRTVLEHGVWKTAKDFSSEFSSEEMEELTEYFIDAMCN